MAQEASNAGPANRLARETSPYLRQHAHNPVDWYPWGEEAFAKARAEEKPVFLSIGYSSCHWCHVMERESFESPEVAAHLNRGFVSIKVDREERPDLDEIYMAAVQLLTQRGGWPMSTWLTPEGRPFHGGTYYPPAQFVELLGQLSELYRTRRDDLEARAAQLTEYLAEMIAGHDAPDGPLNRSIVDDAVSRLGSNFDETYGGFGRAPKFPPSTGLPLLLLEHERSRRADPIRWTTRTLDGMALGGIHDHLGGGFHRYSTDRHWLVPHFEKMLYDNAQLSRIYADAFRITGRPEYRRVAEATYDWVLREMTGEGGGFYSTLDADSEGEEGKFYVWSHDEIVAVLGDEDGPLFARVYNVEPNGNFLDEATRRPTGLNILHLTRPLDAHAEEQGEEPDLFRSRMAALREQLRTVRAERVWPALDDKIIASWNGLMIGSLAHGGRVLDRPDYVAAAARAAEFVLREMRRDGRLLRTFRNGEAKLAGYLEDHAFVCHALLDLHGATGEPRWLAEARALMSATIECFQDDEHGGFFNTASDHEALLLRTKSSYDQAMPSGNSIAALSLLRLADATGDREYLDRARRLLHAFLGLMQRNPLGVETMIRAASLYFDAAECAGIPEESGSAPAPGPVKASVELLASPLVPGGQTTLRVTLEIAPGWHINSDAPLEEHLSPTQLRVSASEGVTLGLVRAPEPKTIRLRPGDAPLSVYDGTVRWEVPVLIDVKAEPGRAPLQLFIDFQACDDRMCQEPATLMAEVPLEILAS